MAFSLSQGPPFKVSLINTEPKQIRSISKADQAYTLRLVYVPVPPAITKSDQTLYLQEEFHEGLYLKFVEKVALSLGDLEISLIYKQLYDSWKRDNVFLASQRHNVVSRLRFSWI